MAETLKPCPFCGELPQVAVGTAMHACRVLDREMRVPVAAWNRRADEPQRRTRRVCRDDAGVPQSFLCSECGWFDTDVDGLPLDYSYCPNCGARVTRGDGE